MKSKCVLCFLFFGRLVGLVVFNEGFSCINLQRQKRKIDEQLKHVLSEGLATDS